MRSSSDLFPVYQVLYDRLGPQGWWPAESGFEMMTGAILTQNTAWKNVEKALLNLKARKALSLEVIRKMNLSELARLIRPSGYFNLKAKKLKALVVWLGKSCAGKIDRLRKTALSTLRSELLKIYGVGPETADSILVYGFRKKSFVIDAYTKRIFSRHGFLKESDSYEKCKVLFEEALPRRLKIYNEFHAMIVKIGKDFCRKIPKCSICPLEEDLKKYHHALKFEKKDRIKVYA